MSVSKWAERTPKNNPVLQLNDAHRLLDALIGVDCMVVAMSPQGEILYCSASLAEQMGIQPTDREAFVDALGCKDADRRRVRRLAEDFTQKSPESLDISISEQPYRLTGITVPGLPLLRMLILRNNTVKKGEKQQLERLERLATVGQVAAGAVHEFNNNLTSILGWAQIAEQNTDPDSPTAAAVGIIAENAKKARRIFSKLLTMSRTKGEEESHAPVSPTKIVDDALGILFFEMKNRNIRLTRAYEEVGLCRADEDRLGQVFINIIKNAMEAVNRNGELIVSAKQDKDMIRISFRDTGPGMSAETATRVFDPFFTTKKKDISGLNGGTGLGLSISLDILRQHGGDIEVSGKLGAGACFTVTLPLFKDTEENGHSGRTAHPTIPPGAMVLVADDEPDIGEMIRMSLELKGISVLSVQSGEDAIGQLKKMRFDAAFVDYSMPGLSGHDLGREILSAQPDLPLIFMSGLSMETDDIVGDFIKKPFELDEIQEKLYEVLKRRKNSSCRS